MVKIAIRDNEDLKNALRRFRKACEKDGVIRDMKKYMHYESPGQRKRKEKMRNKKNKEKEQKEAVFLGFNF